MASNVLGLFLLTLAGLSNALSFRMDLDAKSIFQLHPWRRFPYRDASQPFATYHDYMNSRGDYWYGDSYGIRNGYEVSPFGYIKEESSDEFGNPNLLDIYSKLNSRSTSSAAVNIALDSYMTGQKSSDFKDSSESSKDIPDTEITSNPEILQTNYNIPYTSTVERQHESLSLLKKDDLNIIDNKNSFTASTIKSAMDNKKSQSASEFVTNTFTNREEADSSFMDKKDDPIDRKILPNRNLQTESTVPQKSFSVTIQGGISKFPDSAESANSQKYDMFTNEGKVESKSKLFQSPSSITTSEVMLLGDKSSSLVNTETTYSKDLKSESIITESSSLKTDGDISLKIKSSSPEGSIRSRNTQHFETESTISQSPPTATNDDTALQSKSSPSFETKSTAADSEIVPTTENVISSSKYASVLFRKKVTEGVPKETFYTESPFPKVKLTSGGSDRVIEISSIHTARIVITSMFLVIAFIAFTVLVVFMFTLRRYNKNVQYDQLQLIS